MPEPDVVSTATRPLPVSPPKRPSARAKLWCVALAVLIAAFYRPLAELMRFALQSSLYSHIPLIPLVSLYFVWIGRRNLPALSRPDILMTSIFGLAGGMTLAVYGVMISAGAKLPVEDALALTTLAFVSLLVAACAAFFGRPMLRLLAFPLGFLVFMAPMPLFATHAIESVLQHGSASVACTMFELAGTPVLRSDLLLQLPNIKLEVAPECSGIHSSLALLITTLVAGRMFLDRGWQRVLLTLAVVPLAFLRNGLRIFTIGELCVHISPEMIHSYIHKQGGPIFFIISLVPLLAFLFFLMRYNSSRIGKLTTLFAR